MSTLPTTCQRRAHALEDRLVRGLARRRAGEESPAALVLLAQDQVLAGEPGLMTVVAPLTRGAAAMPAGQVAQARAAATAGARRTWPSVTSGSAEAAAG